MKEIIDKLDFIKIKNFCFENDNIQRIRRQATDWERIFAKEYNFLLSDKGLLYSVYKEYLKLNNKKTDNPI